MEEMQRQIDELKKEIESIKSSNTIPYEVEQALRDRLRLNTFTTAQTSSKVTGSENQAVNEGGAATYSVLSTPDGWIEITFENNTVYIPKWNS